MYKLILVLIFLLLIIVIIRSTKVFNDEGNDKQNDNDDNGEHICEGDCGTSCTLQCTLDALKNGPTYYNDEELDVYRGIDEREFSPKQIEDFDEVLSTLRVEDIYGWLVSLQQRGIALPIELKDAAYIMIQEFEMKEGMKKNFKQ